MRHTSRATATSVVVVPDPGAADNRQVLGRLPSAGELPLPDGIVHQPGRGPARAGRFGEARRVDLDRRGAGHGERGSAPPRL